MEISEFRVKMRELLDDVPASNETDEVFWERAGDLFEAVVKAKVDANRATQEYRVMLAQQQELRARQTQRPALGPDQLTTVPSFTSVDGSSWLDERQRRLSIVAGWSGFLWGGEQIAAIKKYVDDGVVTSELPRRYRDAASSDR